MQQLFALQMSLLFGLTYLHAYEWKCSVTAPDGQYVNWEAMHIQITNGMSSFAVLHVSATVARAAYPRVEVSLPRINLSLIF